MKKLLIVSSALVFVLGIAILTSADVRIADQAAKIRYGIQRSNTYVFVRGYTTKKGTFVEPHHRTNPNDTKLDNWSTQGNINPFTGKEGTKNPYPGSSGRVLGASTRLPSSVSSINSVPSAIVSNQFPTSPSVVSSPTSTAPQVVNQSTPEQATSTLAPTQSTQSAPPVTSSLTPTICEPNSKTPDTGINQIVQDDFDSYSVGSLVGQGGWQSYKNGQNFIIQDVSGKKVLFNNGQGDSVVTKSGISLANGRQAIYIKTVDRSNWGHYADGNAQVRVSKGSWGTAFSAVSFKSDGNVAYYDRRADKYVNFATYSDCSWTLLEIEWRATNSESRFRVNGGAWTNWVTFGGSTNSADFDHIGFDFVLPSGSGGVYFDALY